MRVVLDTAAYLAGAFDIGEPGDQVQAMSMPADTPAAVMTSPSSTKRSSGRISMLGSAAVNSSKADQYVVAGRPASRPAAA